MEGAQNRGEESAVVTADVQQQSAADQPKESSSSVIAAANNSNEVVTIPAHVQHYHVRTPSANSSPRSSPSLQRKGSDLDIKFSNVGQALMNSSTLSSTLAIPKQTFSVSAGTSPVTSREPSVEVGLQGSIDSDSVGCLPQNIPNEQRDVNGSQDNVSRSSESGRSFDGSSFSAQRSFESRLDNDKVYGRSSSGETKGTFSSTGKTSEKKKKSTAWYNVLNPTYKSRSEDFKKIFKDLPESERLIVDYSCAMQKDFIVHGRLYLSQNYICFYATIFRWETTVVLKCKDVTSMTKERTARVIPNAIQICTDSEKHFFTSFGARDKTYLMLFRVWQNALLDQPMTIQELWQWVHYSYGEELGLTSDDDDYVAPPEDKTDAIPDSCGMLPEEDKNQITSDIVEDEIDGYKAVDDSSVFNNASLNTHLLADGSPKDPLQLGLPLMEKRVPKHSNIESQKIGDVPTDMSDTTDTNEQEAEIPCPCSSHEGKEIVNEVFSFSVDQMFSLLFTGSKFLMTLLECRKIYDIVQSSWKSSDQPHKIRQLTYTVSLNNPMSPKTAPTTETQTLLDSKPEQLYIVRSDVVTTGIPYGDSFTCYTNYCITKVNSKKCRMKVFVGVTYKKSVFGLVKGFIDKNAFANMHDYFNDLCIALHREAGSLSDLPPKPKKSRRRRRIKIGETKPDYGPEVVNNIHSHSSIRKPGSSASQVDTSISNVSESFIKIVFVTLLLLLFLNFMLFYKLWVLEEQTGLLTSLPSQGYLNLHKIHNFETDMPQSNEEWMKLLQKQEILNNIEREKWKSLVSDVIKLIQTTESSLSQLFDSIQGGQSQVPSQKSSTTPPSPPTTTNKVNQRINEQSSK